MLGRIRLQAQGLDEVDKEIHPSNEPKPNLLRRAGGQKSDVIDEPSDEGETEVSKAPKGLEEVQAHKGDRHGASSDDAPVG
ncbi:MAG: hypothetical protein GY772_01885 [bacterium]|nr:hypothetical protein [bacterium]